MGHFSDDVYYPHVDSPEEIAAKQAEKRATVLALKQAIPVKRQELQQRLAVDPNELLELCLENATNKEDSFWMVSYNNNLNLTTTGGRWADDKIVPVWRPINTDSLAGGAAFSSVIEEEKILDKELDILLKEINEYNRFCYGYIAKHYMRQGKRSTLHNDGWEWKPGMKPEL